MRIQHLEGLRGVACLQVVALHALGAFRPGLVDGPAAPWELAVRQSPLRLLYDGDAAVFLFFVLSGFVLTGPFRRDAARPIGLVAARLVRFLVPALLACLLGLATARLLGWAPEPAGRAIGSGWLLGGLPGVDSLAGLLREATVNALLLGYRDISALSPWLGEGLWPNQASLDPPLWTLSVEMQGSLLVLALVQAGRVSRRAWGVAVAVAALACLRSPLLCFVAGHLAAGAAPGRTWLAVAAAGLGLVAGWGEAAAGLLDAAALPMLPGLEPGMTVRGWAAILAFPVLLHARLSRRLMGGRVAGWLGRMSFPLYLVHWPMLFGPGAGVMLAIAPSAGVAAGALCGMAAGLAASLLLAAPFAAADRLALDLARAVRRLAGPPRAFVPEHAIP